MAAEAKGKNTFGAPSGQSLSSVNIVPNPVFLQHILADA
jgi:hypothetical protein